MQIPYYQVDAFTSHTFGGNPAGVCILENWLPDEVLQNIAAENNLSETAFLVPLGEDYHLRWFTPVTEVDLCGHATLASAFILFTEMDCFGPRLRFQTRSGWLSATRYDDIIELDFPSYVPEPCFAPEELVRGLGHPPKEVLKARQFLLAVYDSQAEVAALKPDPALLAQLDGIGVIATAPGDETDFVSRFFAPKAGIPEDPVTGSAHSALIPFWADRLQKTELYARQISQRGGELHCRLAGERVSIGGRAVLYSRAELEVPETNF